MQKIQLCTCVATSIEGVFCTSPLLLVVSALPSPPEIEIYKGREEVPVPPKGVKP